MIMYSKTRTFLRFSVVRRQGVGALRTNPTTFVRRILIHPIKYRE